MKRLSLVLLTAFAASALTLPVFAENGPAKGAGEKHHKFKDADTDGDGKLSPAEFAAGFPKGDPEKRFATADTNNDGFLTREELKAAHDKRKAESTDKKSE